MLILSLLLPVHALLTTASGNDPANVVAEVVFYPAYKLSVSATCCVRTPDEKSLVAELKVDEFPKYEIHAQVPQGNVQYILQLSIDDPEGYVSDKYTKQANVAFESIMKAKRPVDAREDIMTRPDASLQDYELALDWSDTAGQKYEALRRIIALETDVKQQQHYYGIVSTTLLDELGPRRRWVYFRERLDAFLATVGFAGPLPNRAFAEGLANSQKEIQSAWSELVGDCHEYYGDDLVEQFQEATYLAQFEEISRILNEERATLFPRRHDH